MSSYQRRSGLRTALALAVLTGTCLLLALGAENASALCAAPPETEKREYYRELLKEAHGAIIGTVLKVRDVKHHAEPGEAVPAGESVTVYRVGKAFKRHKQFERGTRIRIRRTVLLQAWD